MTASIEIRAVEAGDEPRWRELFRAYRDFYRLEPDEEVVDRVWSWLRDPASAVEGLVAVADAGGATRVIGFAHHRAFPRPSAGVVGTYLDDLYVDPDHRGAGAARALITRLAQDAAEAGRPLVRWITAEDNTRARALYDSVAAPTPWVTYDLRTGA
ncbi:GNAT family N-acetyltransferase [Homoserinibacter sp. YIM 151385]|uniref:GNAT family N-acetyltransferase n=1 Tax=Homoserinibacter sp. YIM 151385 TaxID=2985506 RepID=UPI0022F12FD2|nr:GNAT family N-acetyltransferase [Homoserinibacter sp. YIM 151385]WBU36729.1 GNAT family N-acetyltransferase [Homoserinibacter sp. YIM 151385]